MLRFISRLWLGLISAICFRVESASEGIQRRRITDLERDNSNLREHQIESLNRKVAVLEEENKVLHLALQRERHRVQAELVALGNKMEDGA